MSMIEIITYASTAFGGGAVAVKVVEVFRKREQSPAAAETERAEIEAKSDLVAKLIARVEKLEGAREADQYTIRGMAAEMGTLKATVEAQARTIADAEVRESALERRLSDSEARNITLHSENEDLRRAVRGASPPEPTGRHGVMR